MSVWILIVALVLGLAWGQFARAMRFSIVGITLGAIVVVCISGFIGYVASDANLETKRIELQGTVTSVYTEEDSLYGITTFAEVETEDETYVLNLNACDQNYGNKYYSGLTNNLRAGDKVSGYIIQYKTNENSWHGPIRIVSSIEEN